MTVREQHENRWQMITSSIDRSADRLQIVGAIRVGDETTQIACKSIKYGVLMWQVQRSHVACLYVLNTFAAQGINHSDFCEPLLHAFTCALLVQYGNVRYCT